MESDNDNKSYVRQFIYSSIGLFIMLICYSLVVIERQDNGQYRDIINVSEQDHIVSTIYFYDMSDSMAGNYLSARYAKSVNKYSESAKFYQKGLDADPNNTDLLHKTFISHLLSGNIDEAVVLIEHNKEYKDIMLLAQMVSSVDLIKNGRYLEAEEVLMGMLRDHSDELTSSDVILCSIMIAWTKVGNDNFREGLGLLNTLSSADNMESIWYYHMALISEANGLYDQSKTYYERVLENNDTQTYEHIKSAERFHRRIGNMQQAQTIFNNYMHKVGYEYDYKTHYHNTQNESQIIPRPTVQSGVSEVILSVVRSLYENQRYHEAIIYLHLILHLDPNNESAHFLLGLSLSGEEMFEEANYHLNKIINDKYLSHYAVLHSINNLYHLGKPEEAIDRLYNISDNSSKLDAKKDALIMLGDILRIEERFKESKTIYDTIIENQYAKGSDEEWRIFYNRAISYEKLGNWEKAENDFLKSLELNPNHPDILNYLAYSWLTQDKNIDTAKEMIEIAYEARPEDPHIIDSMGWALLKTGDPNGAIEYLEKAVMLKPNDPVLHDHLGDVYWLTGRKNEARFQWAHAINYDDKNQYTHLIQDKIEHGLRTANSKRYKEAYISLSK